MKVLIVDDAAFMRVSLRTMMERNGCEVVGEASNGSEAVAKYKQFKPDLVTMDITMPEMNGIEALKAIKSVDAAAKVMMISAMGLEEMVKDAVLAGAIGFILKPFKEEQIVKVIGAMK